jgi:hypothetical protein
VSFAYFTLSGTKVQIKIETAKEMRSFLRREGDAKFRELKTIVLS